MHKLCTQTDLSHSYPLENPNTQKQQPPTFELSVIQLVSKQAKVAPDLIFHHSRCRAHIARARQLAMYLLHVVAGRTMAEIGDWFGRDRTTVSHACQRVEDRRDCPEFDADVTRLEQAIETLLVTCGVRDTQSEKTSGEISNACH